MKVLYVEDNPANVFLVKRVAKVGKHEIINYIDGDVALKKFDEVNPDLILMDIQLAGNQSGLDVVKALRARGVKTPIIAVTAYAMVGDKERCLAAGCDDYMAKPLPVPRLVELFQHYSDLAEQASTTPEAETETPVNTTETADSPKAEAEEVSSATTVESASTPVTEETPSAATEAKTVDETVKKKPSEKELSESDNTLPVRPTLQTSETKTVSTSDKQNSVQSNTSTAEENDETAKAPETTAEPADTQ